MPVADAYESINLQVPENMSFTAQPDPTFEMPDELVL